MIKAFFSAQTDYIKTKCKQCWYKSIEFRICSELVLKFWSFSISLVKNSQEKKSAYNTLTKYNQFYIPSDTILRLAFILMFRIVDIILFNCSNKNNFQTVKKQHVICFRFAPSIALTSEFIFIHTFMHFFSSHCFWMSTTLHWMDVYCVYTIQFAIC